MYKQMLSSAYTAVMENTSVVNTVDTTTSEPEINISDPEHTVVNVPDNIEAKKELDLKVSQLKRRLDKIMEIKDYIRNYDVNRTLISLIGRDKLSELFNTPVPGCENLGPHTKLPKLTDACLHSTMPAILLRNDLSDAVDSANRFYNKVFSKIKSTVENNNIAHSNCRKLKLSRMFGSVSGPVNSISNKGMINIKNALNSLNTLNTCVESATVKDVLKHPFITAILSPDCSNLRLSGEYISNDKKLIDKHLDRLHDVSSKTLLNACEAWNTKLGSLMADEVASMEDTQSDEMLKQHVANLETLLELRDRLMEVTVNFETARTHMLRQYKLMVNNFYRK